MKKIMTSLVLALFATAALAQQKQGSFSFVPRVGVTIANLTDNDLTLERGVSTCIVGANGAGKSTFALTLAGLLSPHQV